MTTIIVLIILAGVTLNMLFGENGLINRTKTARDKNEKATATETMNLKITNVQISKYAEEQRMPTLKELADNFCEDDDFQYVQETSKVASLTKITNNNPTSIYTKLKSYPYEFEINSSLQLASIDGVKVATVPANDDDTIVSMTKAELQNLIDTSISSKMNIYSTTKEQVIGTWIDGKPLYRKVITGLKSPSQADTWENLYTEENVEMLMIEKGFFYTDDGKFEFNYTSGSGLLTRINGNTIKTYALNNSHYCNINIEIIINYTKTTPASTE